MLQLTDTVANTPLPNRPPQSPATEGYLLVQPVTVPDFVQRFMSAFRRLGYEGPLHFNAPSFTMRLERQGRQDHHCCEWTFEACRQAKSEAEREQLLEHHARVTLSLFEPCPETIRESPNREKSRLPMTTR